MTIVVVAIIVVLLLVAAFFIPAGPARVRSVRLDSVGEVAGRLAMMHTGSSMTVRHDGTRRSFSLVKAPDSGSLQQTVEVSFSEVELSTTLFGDVVSRMEELKSPPPWDVRGNPPERVLTCWVTGQSQAMPFLVNRVISPISSLFGSVEENRFTIRVDGSMDYAIFRRVNLEGFVEMGQDKQHWIARRFARRQLRKHESETSGPTDEDG